MQSFAAKKGRWEASVYGSANGLVPLLLRPHPALTILETTVRGAVEAGVALRRTKSAIAGEQSEGLGQTTTTGGVPQSGPCAQPSALIKPQETVEKKRQRKGPLTGTPVSPRHDAPLCGPAPLLRSPLPQISIILRHSPLLAWPPK